MSPDRHALLYFNRHSRHGATITAADIMARLEALGLRVAEPLESIEGLRTRLREDEGAGMVVIAGGDGTVNAALDTLVEHPLPMALLPMGTANDLARTLRIPLALEDALEVAANGRIHAVDVGWVNGKHFINAAHIGLPVQVKENLTGALKRRWGVIGYAIGALRALRAAQPFRAHIRYQNRRLRLRAVQISVGNGRYHGGGMQVSEDAAIDDGLLHLYALEPRPAWKYLRLLPAMRLGRQGELPDVRTLTAAAFDVTTRQPMPINTDGEITTQTPGHFRVVEKALCVMVPQTYLEERSDLADAA